MLSLREYLAQNDISKSAFAQRLKQRTGRRVPKQSMTRWTLPIDDPNYSVPRSQTIKAIEAETAGQVPPNAWYGTGQRPKRRSRPKDVSSAASRKGWETRRRQQAVQP
jgi:hypothetical protein